jgi:flagellar basal body rod protein FlgG
MSLNGIAISGRGALAQSAKINVIARNIANLRTAGYRPESVGFNARLEAIVRAAVSNGQRVGEDGQLVGWNGQREGWDVIQGLGKNGQRVGMDGDVDAGARRPDVLGEDRTAPVLESAELIRALRALEANLQAIRIQDSVLERTVNELARPVK